MRPARARTPKCFDTAASEMPKGAATSVTAMSSSKSIDRIARRVGSAKAAKTESRSDIGPAVPGTGAGVKDVQRNG